MELRYTIDRHDRIIRTGGRWDQFAGRNGGGALTVANTSLWQHVTGTEVRHLYQLLLRHVRSTHRSVSYLYRCDAPGQTRRMKMILEPGPGQEVTFRSQMQSEEERHRVALLCSNTPRDERLLDICSWCAAVRLDDDWVSVDEAIDHLSLFDCESMPRITHGVCKTCHERVVREIEQEAHEQA